MQRIWNDSKLTVLSEDSELLSALAGMVEADVRIQVFHRQDISSPAFRAASETLILWDLDAAGPDDLKRYIAENPKLLPSCSLFFIGREASAGTTLELMQKGAVDFLIKPIRPLELKTRLELARRTWVRGMRTTFDFLSDMNVEFTLMEQKIFLCFLASPDFSASRNEINTSLWDTVRVNSNTLDVHLFNMRRKLEPNGLQISFINKKGRWVMFAENDLSDAATTLPETGGSVESKR